MTEPVFYLDPLSLVFIPSAAVMVAAMAAPVAYLRRFFWVRRANARNRSGTCGRCGQAWGSEEAMFVYSGVFVCEACGDRMRRALSIALPAFVLVVLIGAVVSATGFVLGGPWAGGPSLEWWFGGMRWVALLLPSVGVGTVGWMVVRHVKHENQLAKKSATSELLDGDDHRGQITPGHG